MNIEYELSLEQEKLLKYLKENNIIQDYKINKRTLHNTPRIEKGCTHYDKTREFILCDIDCIDKKTNKVIEYKDCFIMETRIFTSLLISSQVDYYKDPILDRKAIVRTLRDIHRVGAKVEIDSLVVALRIAYEQNPSLPQLINEIFRSKVFESMQIGRTTTIEYF